MLDKDKLFEILNEWNFWFRELPKFYDRKVYSKRLTKISKSGEVIVIKGVRRSGKSTLLLSEIERLIQEGIDRKNILFVNFEDQRFKIFDEKTLLEDIKKVYLEYIAPKGDIVIMLDEVQNIPQWEKWVLKEYELSKNLLYVTGSNSHLLSGEFSSALSGRYLDIEVFPLSFKEFLSFAGLDISTKALFLNSHTKILQLFKNYMEFGGFPKVALTKDEELKKDTLKVYYDTILLRDIVARYKLKNYQLLNELSLFLLSNNSTIQSYNKLKNNFQTSFDTIKDYIEYLQNSYMIFTLNKFDYSFKKQLANPKKVYAIDTGLSNQVSFKSTEKLGANLENIVFLELKRRGKKIFYYKTSNNLEIDFLVDEDEYFELIQVTTSLKDEVTKKRELRAFFVAKKELNKDVVAKVITLDNSKTISKDGIDIEVINLIEWLLL